MRPCRPSVSLKNVGSSTASAGQKSLTSAGKTEPTARRMLASWACASAWKEPSMPSAAASARALRRKKAGHRVGIADVKPVDGLVEKLASEVAQQRVHGVRGGLYLVEQVCERRLAVGLEAGRHRRYVDKIVGLEDYELGLHGARLHARTDQVELASARVGRKRRPKGLSNRRAAWPRARRWR